MGLTDGDDWIYLDDPEPVVSEEPEPEPELEPEPKSIEIEDEQLPPVPVNEDEQIDSVLVPDGVHEFDWPIAGMDCPDCARIAVRSAKNVPGVVSCEINPADGVVRLNMDLGKSDVSKVSKVLTGLGHEPDLPWLEMGGVTLEELFNRHDADRTSMRRLLLSTPGILDVRFEDGRVLIRRPEGLNADARVAHQEALERLCGTLPNFREVKRRGLSSDQQRLIGATIALLALGAVIVLELLDVPTIIVSAVGLIGVVLGGWRMFREALASIRNYVLGFQVLISLAVIGAAVLQEWPEALTVVLLEAVSGHLEATAVTRARDAMQGGLNRLPRTARIVSASTVQVTGVATTTYTVGLSPITKHSQSQINVEEKPIDLVTVGDLVEVRSGELLPVDGVIVEGAGQVDKAPMTGESVPVRVEVDDVVEAGLVLLRGPVVVQTTAVGDETKLAGLIDRVHTYRDQPPRMQPMVELFTHIWVPLVIVGGILISLLTGEIMLMLLLWVVSCPCALLLAAPVPHAAALSNAAHQGIVARGGDVLERVAKVDLALLDKTGTLTCGKPRLDSITLAEGVERRRALRLAAGLEQRSNHPYAGTILEAMEADGLSPMKVTSLKDENAGVSGKLQSRTTRFGRDDWLESLGVEMPEEISAAALDARTRGLGLSVLSEDGSAIALFAFENDDLRMGADTLLRDLKELGLNVELLSGDAQPAVESLGVRLGLDPTLCRGEIDPDGKAIWVNRRSQERRTMMAGDGFNDAAALAAADVGVAVGSGEQVNLEAADVLIPSEDPRLLSRLVRLSRRTRMVVILNLAISFIVTIVLVATVLTGKNDSLAIGVLAHEASAILVLINGIWLADEGVSRIGLLSGLFKDLGTSMWEAWSAVASLRSPTGR